MNRDDATYFAEEWIRNWNARDIDRIVSHFAEGARFTSPVALKRTGHRDVVGRQALQSYWSAARSYAVFRFTMERIVWDQDQQELVIVYDRDIDGRQERACELLRFNESGQVVSGEAMYGAGF